MTTLAELREELRGRLEALRRDEADLANQINILEARVDIIDERRDEVEALLARVDQVDELSGGADPDPSAEHARAPRRDVRGDVLEHLRTGAKTEGELSKELGIPARGIGKALAYWLKKNAIRETAGRWLVTPGAQQEASLSNQPAPAAAAAPAPQEEYDLSEALPRIRAMIEHGGPLTAAQFANHGIPAEAISAAAMGGYLTPHQQGKFTVYDLGDGKQPAAAAE